MEVIANTSEPIVKHAVIRGTNVVAGEVQYQGHLGRMTGGKTHENTTTAARFPSGKSFPTDKTGIQDIRRTAPNMQIVEMASGMFGTAQEIQRRQTGVRVRGPIIYPSSMLNCKGPVTGVGNIRPMDRLVQHHGSGKSGDSANGTFGRSILVVRSRSGKAAKLTKMNKIFVELTAGESGTLVHPIVFDRHTMGGPVLFQAMFCNQGIVGGEALLEGNINAAAVSIHKTSPTFVHFRRTSRASGAYETATLGRLEVINKDGVTGGKAITFRGTEMLGGMSCGLSIKGTASAFAECTRSAFGNVTVCGASVGNTLGGGRSEDMAAEQSLDATQIDVTETLMPTKQQLLGCRQVGVVGIQDGRVHLVSANGRTSIGHVGRATPACGNIVAALQSDLE